MFTKKVGNKYRAIRTNGSDTYEKGDIVTLTQDDGSELPYFTNETKGAKRRCVFWKDLEPYDGDIKDRMKIGNYYRVMQVQRNGDPQNREEISPGDILRLESTSDINGTIANYYNITRSCPAAYIHIDRLEEYNKEEEETTTMNEETKQKPAYIIIVKNTEVFKKGGVLRYYDSFYAPEVTGEAYQVMPYDKAYVTHEQVQILLDKKVAVEAVQFSPKFVTVEQNEILQKALVGITKKNSPKPAAKKKTTKKAAKSAK